jgi:hypothetical protein
MTTHKPPDPPPTVGPAVPKPLPRAAALTPEQEIRARALDTAGRLLARLLGEMPLSIAEFSIDLVGGLWLRLAELGAAQIRDGSRPGDGGEDDRDRRR